jgi:hypothetical protein
VRSHAAGPISFIDKALQHVSAQQWIQKGFVPLAQEPALFGHFTGAEPDFTEDFPPYCQCRMEQRHSISLPRVSVASRRTCSPVRPIREARGSVAPPSIAFIAVLLMPRRRASSAWLMWACSRALRIRVPQGRVHPPRAQPTRNVR